MTFYCRSCLEGAYIHYAHGLTLTHSHGLNTTCLENQAWYTVVELDSMLECVMGEGICERLSTFIYLFIYLFIFNVYLFLRETEMECEWGRGRQRQRHRIQNGSTSLFKARQQQLLGESGKYSSTVMSEEK